MKVLSPAMAALIVAPHATIGTFALLDLPGAPLRLCDADQDVRWGGQTWAGAGELAQISEIVETASGEVPRFTMSLSGIAPDRRALILGTPTHGRTVTLWLAGFDETTWEVVSNPVVELVGVMDAPVIATRYDEVEKVTTCVVDVPVTSREARWAAAAAAAGRRTDADQQARFPGDKFYLHVAKTAMAKPLVWPAAAWFRQ